MCSDLAAARARRLGVFVRNSDIWSRLNHVRKIIFDKTGTLTLESISLRNPEELAFDNQRSATMLIYQYDVAGVSYEASQDVTYLRQWINLHSCRLGLPTSVKYDPQNPGNSLVVSENWMGLRQ